MGKNDNTYGGKSKKDWEDWGFKKPAIIKAWVDNGFTDPSDAKAWVDNGFPDPAVAKAWVDNGFTNPSDAKAWIGSGFTNPAVAKTWVDNGFKWKTEIGDPVDYFTAAQEAAAAFKRLEFSPQDAGPWFLRLYVSPGIHISRPYAGGVAYLAMDWMRSGFTDPNIVWKWLDLGVDKPEIAREWVENLNIDINKPGALRAYKRDKKSPPSAWAEVLGTTDLKTINDFQDVFVGPDGLADVRRWRSCTGIEDLRQLLANAKIWVETVGSTKKALEWRAEGITNIDDVQAFINEGADDPKRIRGVHRSLTEEQRALIPWLKDRCCRFGKRTESFLEKEIFKWCNSGFRDPEVIKQWVLAVVYNPDDADELRAAGFNPESYKKWYAFIHRLETPMEWEDAVSCASRWLRAGFDPEAAWAWKPIAKTPGEAKGWMDNGFSLDQAKAWWGTCGLYDAIAWRAAGFEPKAAFVCRRRGIGPKTAKKRGFNAPDIISKSKAWSAAGLDFVVKYYCDQYSVDLNEAIEIGFGYQDGSTTIKKKIIKFKQYKAEPNAIRLKKTADFAVKQKDGLVMMQYGDIAPGVEFPVDPTPEYVVDPTGLQQIIVQAVSKKALMAAENNDSDGFIILRFPKTVQRITIEKGVNKVLNDQINKHHCYMKLIIWTTKQGSSRVFMEGKSGPMLPVNSMLPRAEELKKISVLHVNNKNALKSLRRFK